MLNALTARWPTTSPARSSRRPAARTSASWCSPAPARRSVRAPTSPAPTRTSTSTARHWTAPTGSCVRSRRARSRRRGRQRGRGRRRLLRSARRRPGGGRLLRVVPPRVLAHRLDARRRRSLSVAASIGRARSMRMALLAEPLTARRRTPPAWSATGPDDELAAYVSSLAARLAAGPPLAYAATKKAVNAAILPGLEDALERERSGQTCCCAPPTPRGHAGLLRAPPAGVPGGVSAPSPRL